VRYVTTKASEEIVNPPSARISHQSHKIQPLIACLLDVRKATKVSSLLLESSKSIGRRDSHHYRRWICNVQPNIGRRI
jgi:hypothetical protein